MIPLVFWLNIIFWIWAITLGLRVILNHCIYYAIDNQEVKKSGFQYKAEENILLLFTFWWAEYKTEEDLGIRKRMKASNFLNIIFVIQTIILLSVAIYKYYNQL